MNWKGSFSEEGKLNSQFPCEEPVKSWIIFWRQPAWEAFVFEECSSARPVRACRQLKPQLQFVACNSATNGSSMHIRGIITMPMALYWQNRQLEHKRLASERKRERKNFPLFATRLVAGYQVGSMTKCNKWVKLIDACASEWEGKLWTPLLVEIPSGTRN